MSMTEDEELVAAVRGDEAAEAEIDRIDPPSELMELECGIEVKVLPLRTRQLFKLLRIITHGAGQALLRTDINFNDDPAEFIQKLMTLVLFSVPDAEQEAIDFIMAMVEPVGLVDKGPRDLSDKERQANVDMWQELNDEIWNPDPQDVLSLIERVVQREGAELQSLGKRIRGFLELASKTGQLKAASNGGPSSHAPPASPAASPARSTSSRTSTAGRTRTSSASPSGGSARSPRPSRSGGGKKSAAGAS